MQGKNQDNAESSRCQYAWDPSICAKLCFEDSAGPGLNIPHLTSPEQHSSVIGEGQQFTNVLFNLVGGLSMM